MWLAPVPEASRLRAPSVHQSSWHVFLIVLLEFSRPRSLDTFEYSHARTGVLATSAGGGIAVTRNNTGKKNKKKKKTVGVTIARDVGVFYTIEEDVLTIKTRENTIEVFFSFYVQVLSTLLVDTTRCLSARSSTCRVYVCGEKCSRKKIIITKKKPMATEVFRIIYGHRRPRLRPQTEKYEYP